MGANPWNETLVLDHYSGRHISQLVLLFRREPLDRYDDDRETLVITALAHHFEEFEPVHHRHPQIQEDSSGRVPLEVGERLLSVPHTVDVDTVLVQPAREERLYFNVVVDHQHPALMPIHELPPQHTQQVRPIDRLGQQIHRTEESFAPLVSHHARDNHRNMPHLRIRLQPP